MGAVSIVRDIDHKQRLFVKYQTRDGLRALYETWLPYREPDHPEMQRLQKRIHKVEIQLQAMRP
jgi:hypothetical protein